MCIKLKGCCCMSLRTAGLMHGWGMILLVCLAAMGTWLLFSVSHSDHSESRNTDRGITVFTIFQPSKNNHNIAYRAMVVYAILFLVSGMLIRGIRTNKYIMLLPWLISQFILLAFTILYCGFLALLVLVGDYDHKATVALVFFVLCFLYNCLMVWSWFVIFSLYKEIRETVLTRTPVLPYPVTVQTPVQMQLLPNGTQQPIVSPDVQPLYQVQDNQSKLLLLLLYLFVV